MPGAECFEVPDIIKILIGPATPPTKIFELQFRYITVADTVTMGEFTISSQAFRACDPCSDYYYFVSDSVSVNEVMDNLSDGSNLGIIGLTLSTITSTGAAPF